MISSRHIIPASWPRSLCQSSMSMKCFPGPPNGPCRCTLLLFALTRDGCIGGEGCGLSLTPSVDKRIVIERLGDPRKIVKAQCF